MRGKRKSCRERMHHYQLRACRSDPPGPVVPVLESTLGEMAAPGPPRTKAESRGAPPEGQGADLSSVNLWWLRVWCLTTTFS